MFPGQLATGPFSLRQGERCCALSISAELSPEGELTAHSVAASRVTPAFRMTYEQVDAAIASDDPEQLTPDLRALMQVCYLRLIAHAALPASNADCLAPVMRTPLHTHDVQHDEILMGCWLQPGRDSHSGVMASYEWLVVQASQVRQAWRTRQGAANISLDECEVRVADAHSPDPRVTLERVQTWESPARTLVSEMMILAGQVAATFGAPSLLSPCRLHCPARFAATPDMRSLLLTPA